VGRVAVSGSVIDWALNRVGVTTISMKRKFPQIDEWKSGQTYPTLNQLENFAHFTRTPLGFFFLEEPPKEQLPIPFFRTIEEHFEISFSPDLIETIYKMQQRQIWVRDYLLSNGCSPLHFVGMAENNDNPKLIAQTIKKILSLKRNWAAQQNSWTEALKFLRNIIETSGIFVVTNGVVGNNTHRKLDPNEFRGFVLSDSIAPLIFVNGSDGKAAQMFTIAHELAHVFIGNSAAFDLRELLPANDPKEQLCNKIAAEFLVPEDEIKNFWPQVKNNTDRFQLIAGHYKVSSIVAARRALDLNLINKNVFLEFYNNYLNDERRTTESQPEGGDFYANQNLRIGKRFAILISQAAREGKILYSEAYRLTGIYGNTFETFTSSLFGKGI